ncbi:hypothetical protein KOI40_09610 [Aestuariicella sp. G3-2]|uniref:hypothetical protein n=1 Tax=Pseudomaricurvus albidus TaxID=2842452 RepID=UPI001C0C3D88|nr:hypothetical protein [Aestuariicella albida]MBU3070076.1 hypothetical protein [Aestuariicella albida]
MFVGLEKALLSCPVVSNPEGHIRDALTELSAGESCLLCFRYDYQQYYLPDSPAVTLLALVSLDQQKGISQVLLGAHTDQAEKVCRGVVSESDMRSASDTLEWPLQSLDTCIRLSPISIAKPWGQEIWYTGIEERGQSQITDGRYCMPLPWFLSLLPDYLTAGQAKDLNLLKILDPLPEEVFGDLYFELHEEKQEVYVVTNVDKTAWPTGTGGIRIGFDPLKRAEFDTDEAFVSAFQTAVKSYEAVRRQIDAELDQCRLAAGVGLSEPVSASQTKRWLASLPEPLLQKEKGLRLAMDAYKATLPLDVGSVLKVPCYTPHSLLHGVRTIEFQTPVYERQILSFAQKVLTQNHWDTDKAVACMNLGDHQLQPLPVIERRDRGSVLIEEVVSFSDFEVWRITLQSGETYRLSREGYALVIGVSGTVAVEGQNLQGEEACLIAAESQNKLLVAGDQDAVLLVSFPK